MGRNDSPFMVDILWRNVRLLCDVPVDLAPEITGEVSGGDFGDVSRFDKLDLACDGGLVAAREGKIVFAGPASIAPPMQARSTVDGGGRLVTPALIDAHTHLVYAGSRACEFAMRLNGVSYEEISRAGGGIAATMRATRKASLDELLALSLPRLDRLIGEGVGTVEIKSGYGLDTKNEIKMLRAARQLGVERPVRIVTSFLGAHALPCEYVGRADDYISLLCDEMLPAIAAEGLADGIDGFCEGIGFSPAQIERLFETAHRFKLPVRLHAEQLSNLGGAALAARHGALSADHLEWLDDAGIAAMAKSGTIAMLLPGAFYACRESRVPPVAGLRAAGVPIALATDCNPGTSPLTSILMAMNMGATLFSLTIAECIAGVTTHAAKALGLGGIAGSLVPGASCDLAIWDVTDVSELVYRMGDNPLHARVWKGNTTYVRG